MCGRQKALTADWGLVDFWLGTQHETPRSANHTSLRRADDSLPPPSPSMAAFAVSALHDRLSFWRSTVSSRRGSLWASPWTLPIPSLVHCLNIVDASPWGLWRSTSCMRRAGYASYSLAFRAPAYLWCLGLSLDVWIYGHGHPEILLPTTG